MSSLAKILILLYTVIYELWDQEELYRTKKQNSNNDAFQETDFLNDQFTVNRMVMWANYILWQQVNLQYV